MKQFFITVIFSFLTLVQPALADTLTEQTSNVKTTITADHIKAEDKAMTLAAEDRREYTGPLLLVIMLSSPLIFIGILWMGISGNRILANLSIVVLLGGLVLIACLIGSSADPTYPKDYYMNTSEQVIKLKATGKDYVLVEKEGKEEIMPKKDITDQYFTRSKATAKETKESNNSSAMWGLCVIGLLIVLAAFERNR